MVKDFEISSTHSNISLVLDSMVKYGKKILSVFTLYNRNGSFEWFLMKKWPWGFRD